MQEKDNHIQHQINQNVEMCKLIFVNGYQLKIINAVPIAL